MAYLAADPPILDRAEESARAALSLVEGQAPTVESLAKVAIGRVLMVRGEVRSAVRLFDDALAQAERSGDMFAATIAIQNRAWAAIALGEPRPEMFERYLRLATRLGNADGAGYAFDGLIAIAVLHGDPERAGVLAGAAAAVRQLTGTQGQPTIETYQPFVASVLQSAAAPIFEAGRARGSVMTVHEATEFALGGDLAHDDDMPTAPFG
jgi:ATP/maltotriose-dependent transcriptional regulator MalT